MSCSTTVVSWYVVYRHLGEKNIHLLGMYPLYTTSPTFTRSSVCFSPSNPSFDLVLSQMLAASSPQSIILQKGKGEASL